MMLIVIDPGHGNGDPGSVGFKNTYDLAPGSPFISATESELNLIVAQQLAAALAQRGFKIEMTRVADDENPTLSARCAMANHAGADLFLSIHHNSFTEATANGFEVLVYRDHGRAHTLACMIVAAFYHSFTKTRRMNCRGIKLRPNLAVLRDTQMPAVLIEMGFLSNMFEETILNSPEFQAEAVELIANEIEEWANAG